MQRMSFGPNHRGGNNNGNGGGNNNQNKDLDCFNGNNSHSGWVVELFDFTDVLLH